MAKHADGTKCPDGIRTETRGQTIYAYCKKCGAFLGSTPKKN